MDKLTKPTPKKRKSTARNKKYFLDIFEKKVCNVHATCQAVGINRWTYYQWVKTDPKFEKSIINSKESLIDFAETQLIKNIKNGNTACLIFFLKTQGKSRGYVEKIDHSFGNGDEVAEFEFTQVKVKKGGKDETI